MVWLMIWLGLDHPIDSFLSSIPFGVCVCVWVCVCAGHVWLLLGLLGHRKHRRPVVPEKWNIGVTL